MSTLFTASFKNTSVERPDFDFDFDDIDYLVDIVDAIEEEDDSLEFDTSEIEITMNKISDFNGGVIEFISDFTELNYDLMVEIGDGGFDQFFEDKDTEYYQYQYLVKNNGMSAEDAIDKVDDVCIFYGTSEDYARDFVSDVYDLPEFAEYYFDYDKFGSDMERDGDLAEVEDGVWVTNSDNI